jgi:hypothetical protein
MVGFDAYLAQSPHFLGCQQIHSRKTRGTLECDFISPPWPSTGRSFVDPLKGKGNLEDSAAFARTYTAPDAQPAAMTFDNSLRERQTKPGPYIFLRRKERLEDLSENAFWNPMTVVSDYKLRLTLASSKADAKGIVNCPLSCPLRRALGVGPAANHDLR